MITTSPIPALTVDPSDNSIVLSAAPSTIAVLATPIKRKAELNPISDKVKDPPKLTAFPLIVILELANLALVTALFAILAVATIPSVKVVVISHPACELFSPVIAPVNLIF